MKFNCHFSRLDNLQKTSYRLVRNDVVDAAVVTMFVADNDIVVLKCFIDTFLLIFYIMNLSKISASSPASPTGRSSSSMHFRCLSIRAEYIQQRLFVRILPFIGFSAVVYIFQ